MHIVVLYYFGQILIFINMLIFSSAVFEENIEVLTLAFSSIYVITEDIYLKIRVFVHY